MKPIAIVTLPEDGTEASGKAALEALQALVRKMLYLMEPTAPLHDREQIRLVPDSDRAFEAARRAFLGDRWQAKAERQRRIDLVQFVASHLQRPDVTGFVVMHVDGDRCYRDSHHGTLSRNQGAIERLLMPPLRASLHARPELLERVLVVVPFWSIEAWLFQNTAVALKLYERHYRSHQADIKRFLDWQRSPAELDEVEHPKKEMSIGSRFNQELASEQFPAQRVYDVQKSFYQAVERLRRCASLKDSLAALGCSDEPR